MPIYEYAATTDTTCAHCRAGFEQLQRLADPELSDCPRCGAAVARRVSAPSVVAGGGHRMKESHLEKHGFTQYRRAGRGVYEKTAGKGPAFYFRRRLRRCGPVICGPPPLPSNGVLNKSFYISRLQAFPENISTRTAPDCRGVARPAAAGVSHS